MIKIIESINDKEKIINIKVNDITGDFSQLIDDIKKTAAMGHTFDVIVDPECEDPRTYEMDGDRSFRIDEVNSGEKQEESVQSEDDFVLALSDVLKSMTVLSTLWNQNKLAADCLNNDKYPFDKSFDELCVEVNNWLTETKKISVAG